MVSERIAQALLRLAARRWPARLRDDMHQEWRAELHVLAAEHRPAAMLRYAASLAVARPVREPVTAAVRVAALWQAVRLCLLAPLAAVVSPIRAGTIVLIAAITVPGFVFVSLTYLLPAGMSQKYALHWPAYVVFFGGLTVLLHAVARLAASGRRVLAWAVGVVGALMLADVAITLPVLLSRGEDPPLASAPWWLFAALNGGGVDGIRLSGMTGDQIWTVGDVTELDAYVFLLYAGLALGVIMNRTARATAELAPAIPEPA
jgi:hypothetical protein